MTSEGTKDAAKDRKTMQGIQRLVYSKDYDKVFSLSTQMLVPSPSPDQVLILVHAASIGAGEVKLVNGWCRLVVSETLPQTPGLDFAGTICSLGTQVNEWKVGDAVFGSLPLASHRGACTEFVVAQAAAIAAKPECLSFQEAAALPVSGAAALLAIRGAGLRQDDQRNKKNRTPEKNQTIMSPKSVQSHGKKVLVRGATGGVGHLLCQLCKAQGAQVVVGVSSRPDIVTQLPGVDACVNYKDLDEKYKGDWVQAVQDSKHEFDVFFDCVGGAWDQAPRLLKNDGIFVAIASQDIQAPISFGFILNMVSTTLWRKLCSWLPGSCSYHAPVSLDPTADDLQTMSSLAAQGKLRPLIDSVHPFTKAGCVAMFNRAASGRAKGKVVMSLVTSSGDSAEGDDKSMSRENTKD